MPRGRKKARTCSTPECQGKPNLFSGMCAKCAAKNCPHTEAHYDSGHSKICDKCGTVLVSRKKTDGYVKAGRGKEAPWQTGGKLISTRNKASVV